MENMEHFGRQLNEGDVTGADDSKKTRSSASGKNFNLNIKSLEFHSALIMYD